MNRISACTALYLLHGYAVWYGNSRGFAFFLLYFYCSVAGGDLYVCLQEDMAKALGQWLYLQGRKNICIDRVKLSPQSFLDIGQPLGPAIPVVVKTLILENSNSV